MFRVNAPTLVTVATTDTEVFIVPEGDEHEICVLDRTVGFVHAFPPIVMVAKVRFVPVTNKVVPPAAGP